MKKVFKLNLLRGSGFLAIIALMVIIGFSFAACDGGEGNGDDAPTLNGTWNADGGRTIIFSGKTEGTFTYTVNGVTTYSGNFTVSGSTITFKTVGVGSADANFTLSKTTLIISGHTEDNSVNGTYTKDGGASGGDIAVTFSGVNANGSVTQTTTQLTLTFSQAITGLSANDITITGVTVTKGTLTNSGATYTLPINGFNAGGTLSVAVAKSGYTISGSPKTATIYYSGTSGGDTAVTLNSVSANGSSTQTTTQLTLTFSQAITGLSASDITLTGISGVTKGTLTNSGATYTLPISGFTSGGTLSVAVSKTGYTISDSPKTATIYYYDVNSNIMSLISVTQNGFSLRTTTQITLIFNKEITGLSASDISLSGVSGVSKGTLSGSGAVYTLPISGFTAGGTLSVNVTKSGISDSSKKVTIYYFNGETISATGTNLAAKLSWLQTNAASNQAYIVEVTADESIGTNTLSYSGKSNVTICLQGDSSMRKVSLSTNGSMFTVSSGVTLVLSNITLSGRSSNTASLVKVNSGGKLVLCDGSVITGNTITSSSSDAKGGGVYVDSGTLLMEGGQIISNTVSAPKSYGGGVYVSNGTVNMNSGKISNNKSTYTSSTEIVSSGGGVEVEGGTFTMNGGEISGNSCTNTSASSRSCSSYGGGVDGYGDFTMNGGKIFDNTASAGTAASNYYSSKSFGGGVCWEGGSSGMRPASNFIINGGEISGNTCSSPDTVCGGGVYMSLILNADVFTKTGGIIYGYSSGDSNSNTVKRASGSIVSNYGHAVYVVRNGPAFRREITAGPSINLDGSKSGSAGGWN